MPQRDPGGYLEDIEHYALHKIAPTIAEKVPQYRDIAGFRSILAHGYAELDHSKVYDIAMKPETGYVVHSRATLRWPFRNKARAPMIRPVIER